jgi:hypothetical protein
MTLQASASPVKPAHHLRDTCRGCGSRDLSLFLPLGAMPLANAFLRDATEFAHEAAYPLDVYFCHSCSLVQLLDVIDPGVLFRDYVYVTGTSDTMAAHNQRYAETVVRLLELGPTDLVAEAGSNDGSLLKCFQRQGVRTLGVEPASNIARLAQDAGIETVNRFFDLACAREMRSAYGSARTVIANNVLAHVDDTLGFLQSCRELVEDDGLVIVEVPYLRELVNRLEYDTIYHEHLCYFSITALASLYRRAGLRIVRVDEVAVHGGSLRVYAAPEAQADRYDAGEVTAYLGHEARAGLNEFATFTRIARDVEQHRRALRDLLAEFVAAGHALAGYGAPAKGNTLLNYCGIGPDLLAYTVDKNPLKIGLFTPGTHIPVLPVATLDERQPDDVLILAWNFAEEIMRQQAAHRGRGGRFIIPLPKPEVV